jgi:hypothetical protein
MVGSWRLLERFLDAHILQQEAALAAKHRRVMFGDQRWGNERERAETASLTIRNSRSTAERTSLLER